jgi:hypothetical protein
MKWRIGENVVAWRRKRPSNLAAKMSRNGPERRNDIGVKKISCQLGEMAKLMAEISSMAKMAAAGWHQWQLGVNGRK